MNIFDLKGKTVLFTASGSHLGGAMSEALACFGANMALTSRNVEKSNAQANDFEKRFGGEHIGLALDISDPQSIKKAVNKAAEKFGGIDILVNNAVHSVTEMLHEISRERWIEGIDGSINGVFNIVREVLPLMMNQKKGNIINIGSMYGMVPPDYQIYEGTGVSCNPPCYGVGKAGFIQLTKYIACYYAKYGIRANAISPGPFPAPKVQENSDFINNLCKKTPAGRIGQPGDLQGIIVLLASDASSYINGQNIAVDGGWTTW